MNGLKTTFIKDYIKQIFIMSKEIYLDAPNIGDIEKKYLNMAVDSNYVSTIGPFVDKFEAIFAKYIGVEKAVSTQSGTAAIHMALYELGIGEEDEVIVPSLTFIAGVNPIVYVRAKPVFADVDAKTWNIDPSDIERLISKKTKAILPVHLYGNPCKMREIMEIAKKYGLSVIEDATESLGAKYDGQHTGTFANFGCFSFNGNKIITTGGGGMVVGNDVNALKHIKLLVNHARSESDAFFYTEVGFNARMTNIEAALGLAQMERLGGYLKKKKKFNNIYQEELKHINYVRFQEEYPEASSSWWFTCILIEKDIDIEQLQLILRTRGIVTRRLFKPVTMFPPYQTTNNCKNAFNIYSKGLCLPSSTLNTEDDICDVCRVLKEVI